VTALERPSGDRRVQFLDFISTYVRLISTSTESVRATWQLPSQHIERVELGKPWRPLAEQAVELVLRLHAETGELPHAQKIAHALCRSGLEAKMDWLDDAWDDHNEPLVVFAQYHDSLDALEEWVKGMGVTYVRVDGSVLGPDRTEAVRKFQDGEVTVFLGQIAAAGIAVDLYRARLSVAFDHTWKGDEYSQALRRTSRRGQDRECYHFDLCANQLQTRVVDRLIAAEDFNTEAVEYQEISLALTNPHTL
jgi:SNF2 family DNA or RNA helicase